jgi:hypothetical protein
MHDTILLSKISQGLKEICKTNNIKKIDELVIFVSYKSHVNEDNLYEYLKYEGDDLIGIWTKIKIKRDDIPDQTAIIHSIQGVQGE